MARACAHTCKGKLCYRNVKKSVKENQISSRFDYLRVSKVFVWFRGEKALNRLLNRFRFDWRDMLISCEIQCFNTKLTNFTLYGLDTIKNINVAQDGNIGNTIKRWDINEGIPYFNIPLTLFHVKHSINKSLTDLCELLNILKILAVNAKELSNPTNNISSCNIDVGTLTLDH